MVETVWNFLNCENKQQSVPGEIAKSNQYTVEIVSYSEWLVIYSLPARFKSLDVVC